MIESKFQADLIKELRDLGFVVLKNDANYLQGVPDLLLLFEDWWGMLEVKKNRNARRQPNQAYYVDLFDSMSFAAVIFPENKEEIIDAIQRSLRARRKARVPRR